MNTHPSEHEWLDRLDLGEVRLVEAKDAENADRPCRGDIWWTASSFDGPAGYDEQDRMPFVILDESHEAGRKWFGAAPVWFDVDLANELDLVLDRDDTTLDIPLRVQLRRQITLAWEQFEDKLGEVRAEGLELIDAALRGGADLDRFGVPYESEHDWRIKADQWAAELIGKLENPFFATLQQVGDAVGTPSTSAGGTAPGLVPIAARMGQWTAADHEFALAARSGPQKRVIFLSIVDPELRGHLWADVLNEALQLHIDHVAREWWRRVELLVRLKAGGSVTSGSFVPRSGLDVVFGEGRAITLGDIDLDNFEARVHRD